MRLSAAPLGLALLSSLLPVFHSTPAQAEGAARGLLVIPYAPLSSEVTQAQADEVTAFVRDQVGQQDGVSVKAVEGSTTSVDERLSAARASVAEALQTAEKAAQLAKGRKVKPAADAYAGAATALLARFEGLENFSAVEQALWQQASLRYLLGAEDEAKKVLADLVRLSPGFVPPQGSDTLSAAYDKARAEAKAQATGRLELVTSPPGATVTLDGRDLGETPLAVEGLVPGTHYVRLLKAGAGVVWQARSVGASSPDRWETVLAGTADGAVARVTKGLRANRFDAALTTAAAEAGKEAGAAFVLIGALRMTADEKLDVRSLLLEASSGKVAELASLSLFPSAMTGLDVYALATDITEKTASFTASEGLGAALFEGLATQGEGALAVVRVDVVGASSPSRGAAGSEGEGRKGRRVVNSAPAAPVATPPVPKEPAAGPADDEAKPRQRVRTRIGEPSEPKADEDAPAPTLKPETGFDLRTPTPDRRLSDLSPEELRRLQEAEQAVGTSPGRSRVLLWGAAGTVVAVGAGWLAYSLLADKPPASTTVQVNWSAAAR
jgi:hypothetical protein